jgi:hypothetical protein
MNNQLFTPDSPVDGGQTPESVSVSHEDSNNEDDDDEILSSLPWWGQFGLIVLMPAAAGIAISLDKLNMLPSKDTVYDKIANLLG